MTTLSPRSTPDSRAILAHARRTLNSPGNWTQGASARNAAGKSVTPRCDQAVQWCLSGSINHAAGALQNSDHLKADGYAELRARSALEQAIAAFTPEPTTPPVYNDAPERRHADIIAVLDYAIALQESDAQNAAPP